MIGVFALRGFEDLSARASSLAERMATKPTWTRHVHVAGEVAIGRVGPTRPGSSCIDGEERFAAVLDGFAYREEQPVGARELALSLLRDGASRLTEFRGEFFLLVHDQQRNRLLAASDRFGVRTAYWYDGGDGTVAVGSELGAMLSLGLLPKRLDVPFVAALLRFNKCRLADRTIFAGVEVVPAGTVLAFDAASRTSPSRTPWYEPTVVEESRSPEEWVEEIVPALQTAALRSFRMAGGELSLALSGGLDSRLVLGALPAEQRRLVACISCGNPISDEVRIAQETAAAAGACFRNVDLGPTDFLDEAKSCVTRNEEFDIFVQGAQARLHRAASAASNAMATGWDLDIQLRGIYLDSAAIDLASFGAVPDLIDSKWRLFGRDELRSLVQLPMREAADGVDDWLRELCVRLPGSTPLQRYLAFIMAYEKRRLLLMRNRMIRFEVESVTPLYDRDLQAVLAGVPDALKVNNSLFASVLTRVAPELAALTYQRTMLPASSPVEFWARGAKLEDDREKLLRDLRVAGSGRVPYVRHYTNFDEWLADDLGWRTLTQELLLSTDTMLTSELLVPDGLKRLVEEHRSSRPRRAELVLLMSLELYLRSYFA